MPNPYKELARLIDDRAKRGITMATSTVSAELGTITASGLKLDRFKYEIRDYLVAEYLTLTDSIGLPEQLKPLKPGDRVLAVPVNGGKDFVVIARVV